MGYPTAYRTSAARRERQHSRPDPSPGPRRPANDNIKIPRKPANDNFPANLPPKPGSWVKHRAIKQAAKLAMNVHPFLRILRYAWDAYDLYQYYKNTQISVGDFTLRCTSNIMSQCINPGVCNQFAYCDGPVFGDGTVNCPSNQAFSYATAHGSAYAAAHFQNATNGFHVVMVRSDKNIPMPCPLRGSVKISYDKNVAAQGANKVARMPQLVPYTTSTPPPWAPFRWYKPEILMKPQVDYDVTPLPPPYNAIPDREMGNSQRGYEIAAEPEPSLAVDYAYRTRPPSSTKEKKVKWTGPAQIAHAILVSLGRVHGKLADFRDIIEAMEKALPKNQRLKGKDKKQIGKRLRNLWDNFEDLNGEQALLNIIEELAEDVVGGVGDRFRKEASENFGWLKSKTFTSPRF
jgi:hypothetical protein